MNKKDLGIGNFFLGKNFISQNLKPKTQNPESGNVMIIVLMGIVLFAALAFVVARSGTCGRCGPGRRRRGRRCGIECGAGRGGDKLEAGAVDEGHGKSHCGTSGKSYSSSLHNCGALALTMP